ncbi:MAG: dNTP triphosphohydrolase [Gallionellaceae bacterium]
MNDNLEESKRADLWSKRLCSVRRKSKGEPASTEKATQYAEVRTEIERDFDRILFSTPVRRLADKTQVFPLDKNDSVRNRLTHSYEVSNLARSLGTALCYSNKSVFEGVENAARDVPALLAAIGLVHDLGNPPFGHQGEAAMQHWFSENKGLVLAEAPPEEFEYFEDFRLFEGNAQGFRLVTRLQLLNDDFGLDLTCATLAAMMKYPTSSNQIDTNIAAKKKHGYFHSEAAIAEEILVKVGLEQGKRHALTYIMEACDDIAYVVLDAEDSVKKGLASFADLMAYLRHHGKDDELITSLVIQSEEKHKNYRECEFRLSPAELNDISMQRFRVFAIGAMIRTASNSFEEHLEFFLQGNQSEPLLEISKAKKLRKVLKDFSLTHGYNHKTVLALELDGFNTIRSLMDMLWFSIKTMTGKSETDKTKPHPFARLVYARISENYRRTFDSAYKTKLLPLWYYQCQLLTDMVSGMTDSYAINLCSELKGLQGDCDLKVQK